MNPIEPTVGVSTDASHDDATLAGEGAPVRSMSGSGPRWPARLGRYVMLQELGQGGMGVVCAAYDQELDRKVAIKLLHGQGDEQALVRLVREAQALARLSHPNVVQIYEIGEFEQLRFLVMEFVDGVTLREWLRSEPRSQAEILAVFDGAGRGLAAAHAEGLVHRDFKPDNVMIHRDGRALVMDFGLARAGTGRSPASHQLSEPTLTQDSLGAAGSMTSGSLGNQLSVELTRTGSLLGTPAYMAPEQFRGLETDAKTDQFAFCVASWEALTGARPFVGDNLAALSLAVTTGTITATAATAGLPSWIRNHLERGLASDPALRWPTMDALLAALRDDPTRRRRGGFAALGVGVAGLALALGLTLASERERVATLSSCEAEGQAIQAEWTDAERTTIEAAFVASDLPMAADTWARAQLAMATYAQAWTELRTEACIETRIEHERDPSEYAALADCLDQHRTVFATLIETWHAPTRRQIAGAASAARNLPPLSACSDPALLAARVELPKTPDARARVAMLRHRLDRAKALRLAFDYAAGLAEAEIALAEAEAFGWPPIVAEARLVVARLHESLGHYDLAQTAMTQAFTEAGAAGDDLLALDAATSLIFLVGHRLGRPESGLVWSEISAMLIGRLGLAGTLQEASWFNLVGVLRDDLGEYPVALDDYGRALAIRETLLGPNNLTVAFSLFNLGATHSTLGHLHDARALTQRALAIREDLLGPNHIDVAATLDNLGVIEFEAGHYAEARAAFQQSLAIWTAVLGPDHIDVAATLINLGAVELELGIDREALTYFESALAIQIRVLGSEHSELAGTLTNMAQARRRLGDLDGALANFRQASELLRALGPDHPRLVFHSYHYGVALAEAGLHEQARVEFERALAIALPDDIVPPATIADFRFGLAKSLWQLGEHDQAREQATLARSLLGDDPIRAKVVQWLAEHEQE